MSREPTAKKHGRAASPAARKKFPVWAVVLAAIAAVVVLGLWLNRSQPAVAQAAAQAGETNAPVAPAAAAGSNAEPGFQNLLGRWRRPDGGYVIEIKRAEANGTLDAAYLNPKPIHVAQATAAREGSAVKVFIELRDVNYPGSTYTLVYEPQSDQLQGIYFQAIQRQNFEVIFVRMK